ncbi:unnamed protein product [Vitrella brassicaformis CCMP3155]|uniref:Uncharacterized protein n=1 Tax=Vitrella brassicaformis (strain CCMP3155) TaxID=1169540 RepID=A0A0G4GSQ4_VITBC|nr:unnamed protein product [Vitrella brassicaformis CCMP3155]|eukprot:CEM33646.1 unnamed protein product [Vitrella brassicaformis CCMP3155]
MAGIGHCEEVLEYVLDGIPVCWPWILAVHCDFFRRIRNVGSQALSTDTSDCQLHFGSVCQRPCLAIPMKRFAKPRCIEDVIDNHANPELLLVMEVETGINL